MLMHNLLEYSSDHFDTTCSLWFYSKDETINFNAVDNNAFKSFKYKAKLLENIETDGANTILKNQTNAVPLNYLSNFWRMFEIAKLNSKLKETQTIKTY